MDFRLFIGPLAFTTAIACSGAAAFGGDLDRHWEAYAALSTPGPETRSGVPATAVSFQFVTREEGHEIPLTDVHVTIVCAVAGKLFEAVSEGPFLVANLPEGRYEVVASHGGRAQRIGLTVARGEPRRVALHW